VLLTQHGELAFHANRELPLRRGNRLFLPMPEGRGFSAVSVNMAEIEFSVLQQQCLDRRMPDDATLRREIAAWETQRHAESATIDWRFSVTDARKKLKRL
jgi:hypothetical protein